MFQTSPLLMQRWVKTLGLAWIFPILLSLAPAHANHFNKYLTTADQNLQIVLQKLQAAYSSGDVVRMIDFYPSKILQQVAKDGGMSEQELKELWSKPPPKGEEGQGADRSIEFLTDRIYSLKLKSGLPIVLIPTIDKMIIDGKKATIELYTLAFEEEGRWRLILMHDQAQYGTLEKVYPEFIDDTIPRDIRHGYRID
jgi:hypothetical protein